MTQVKLFRKSVFFLGAGASKDAGCKTSDEMLESLCVGINTITSEKQKATFSEIYEFIIATLKFKFSLEKQDELARRVINIEDFFMLLRQLSQKDSVLPDPFIGVWNQKITKWEFQQADVFDEFMRFIIFNLKTFWTVHDNKKAEDLLSPIKLLCANAAIDSLDFFTVNYDLVFESQFDRGKELDIGFRKDVWRATFENYELLNGESLEPIKLKDYKLHGSLDWWYDKDDEEVRAVDVAKNQNPFIIFGTDDKVISVDPFLYLLGKFRDRLNGADLYVIIGYSFSDHHINNLILQHLKSDPKKRILVVDPFYKQSKDTAKSKRDLVQYIADIQQRKSSKELQNIAKISESRVEILPLTAKEFYREYFSDGANKLAKYYEAMLKEEEVF